MRKKVLLVMDLSALEGNVRSFGGVDTVCQMHLKGLKRWGRSDHDYVILAFNPANDLVRNGEVHGIASNVQLHWYNYNRRAGLAKVLPNVILNEWLIRSFIKSHRPQVVHSHNPAWHIFKHGDEKKVLTLHSYKKIGRKPVGPLNDFLHERLIQPQSVGAADVVSSVSKEIIDLLPRAGARQSAYVPNPIKESFFCNTRTAPNGPGINLLVSGHVSSQKRTLDAIKVLHRLRTLYADLHLFIAGRYEPSDPYYVSLRDYARTNGLADSVHFLGLLDLPSLRQQVRKIHIGLSLSESETFGLAPLEMMAGGLPVITTEVGVFRWCKDAFVERGVDIIRPGDVTGAAQAIAARIRDRSFTTSPSLRAYLEEYFSLPHYIGRSEELYGNAIAVRGRVPAPTAPHGLEALHPER